MASLTTHHPRMLLSLRRTICQGLWFQTLFDSPVSSLKIPNNQDDNGELLTYASLDVFKYLTYQVIDIILNDPNCPEQSTVVAINISYAISHQL